MRKRLGLGRHKYVCRLDLRRLCGRSEDTFIVSLYADDGDVNWEISLAPLQEHADVLGRYREQPDVLTMREQQLLGGALFEALFPRGVTRMAWQGHYRMRDVHPVEVEVYFWDGTEALWALPLELMHDRRGPLFAGSACQLVRCLPCLPPNPLTPPSVFRLLVVTASPQPSLFGLVNTEPLLQGLQGAGVRVDVLRGASVASLQARLLERHYDYLHFHVHGRTGALLLEGAGGAVETLTPEILGEIIADRAVRMCVLSACRSSLEAGAHIGFARELLRTSPVLDVVVATQGNLPSSAARALGVGLYRALHAGQSYTSAVATARAAMADAWGLAVLCARPQVASVATPDSNLTDAQDDFLGRGAELNALREMLSSRRCVVVSGPAGVGKSRLSWEFGRAERGVYPGGIFRHALSVDSTLVSAVCTVLGLSLPEGLRPEDGPGWLGLELRARDRMLIILDNAENIAKRSERFRTHLQQLLAVADGLHLLLTSRQKLPLGFSTLTLCGLPLPQATALLNLRWNMDSACTTDFRLTTILKQLDCTPLLIEMLAAHLRTIGVEAVIASLSQTPIYLPAPTATSGEVPARVGLATLLEYTWALLALDVQELALRCAIFEGPFTFSALLAVADLHSDVAAQPLDTLVRHHLLSVLSDEHGTLYTMRNTTRLFARSRLSPDLLAHLEERHAEGYQAGATLLGLGRPVPMTSHRLQILQPQLPDLRKAAAWALRNGRCYLAICVLLNAWEVIVKTGNGAPFAQEMDRLWLLAADQRHAHGLLLVGEFQAHFGALDVALEALQAALEAVEVSPEQAQHVLRAEILQQQVSLFDRCGREREALSVIDESLSLKLPPMQQAELLMRRARLLYYTNRLEGCRRDLQQAVQLCLAHNLAEQEQLARVRLLMFFPSYDDQSLFLQQIQQHVDAFAEKGFSRREHWLRGNLGLFYQHAGELARAAEAYTSCIRHYTDSPRHHDRATSYFNMASLHLEQGDLQQAQVLLRKARDVYIALRDLAWELSASCAMIEILVAGQELSMAQAWLGIIRDTIRTHIHAAHPEPLRRDLLQLVSGASGETLSEQIAALRAADKRGVQASLVYLGKLWRVEALVRLAEGDFPGALARIEDALPLLIEGEGRYRPALLVRARCFVEVDPDRAAKALEDFAKAHAQPLSWLPLILKARYLLVRGHLVRAQGDTAALRSLVVTLRRHLAPFDLHPGSPLLRELVQLEQSL